MRQEINLADIINIIKEAAQKYLLPNFARVKARYKDDSSIVTLADLETQKFIKNKLTQKYPEITLLGEEMSKSEQISILNSQTSFWCLDPIDGTSNFAAGLPFFSISLALIEQGTVTATVIYDPIT